MALIDELRERNRLTRMRLGQEAPEIVPLETIPETRVALVPLTEAEYHRALEGAASVEVPDNEYGVELRDRMLRRWTLLYAVRDPQDPSKQLFQNADELAETFDAVEINHLMDLYSRLVDDSSPGKEGLEEEELETLKKVLAQIEWSALSGKPWWHLKNFLLTLSPEQLQVSSSGHSLIKNSIGKSEKQESTPGVSES